MEDNHMLSSERPPSYAQSHDSQPIRLPSLPSTELPQIHHERTLPPLSATFRESSYRPAEVVENKYQPTVWPSSNPLAAYYQGNSAHTSPPTRYTKGIDSPNAMDIDSGTPEIRGRRGGSVLSIDDPDVRLAAEALGDLRADFIQGPPQNHNRISSSSPAGHQQQPEPLLSLLTTSHPLLGTAIGGSLSAYSASKNYSPRFKSSAEYVERRFTPVVNTVGSVGRVTGVEGGVRWFLGGRRPSHHQPSDMETANEGPSKRRKVGVDTEMTTDQQSPKEQYSMHRQEFQLHHRERQPSQSSTVESLPAYDEHRSPSYEANAGALVTTKHDSPSSPGSASWQSRLILSTSGLSVAMSEESLRSLKYCLSWLRWANEHIGKVVGSLKTVLEQYDDSDESSETMTNGQHGRNSGVSVPRTEAERQAMNDRIAELKTDVLKTLKDVVDVVSKYAGGALPDNARILVRRHLTSLPQRFKLASSRNVEVHGDGEATEGARRVMVLAKEGLDMMAQVSGVLDGTIVSAEEWCNRLGRKSREEGGDGETETEDDGDTMIKEPLPMVSLGPVQDFKMAANGNDIKMG